MKWILRKDAPWVLGTSVAGTVALASGLFSESFGTVFVYGARRLDAAFHAAWIAGLVLGAVAACFDEVLGTREFLAQRPLTRGALTAARLRAVLFVLATWFVLAPLGAWIGFFLWRHDVLQTRLSTLAEIFATFVVALSSAGIGLAAGSLPVPWWQRLLAAGAAFGAVFALVHELAGVSGGLQAMGPYVVGHLAAAGLFVGVMVVAAKVDADADRPWPQRLRWCAALPVAVALAVLWAALLGEAQTQAAQSLERAYPQVSKRGRDFVLTRDVEGASHRIVVDTDHRPTGERFDLLEHGGETWGREWWWFGHTFGFDAPRWNGGTQDAWTGEANRVHAVLAADGHAWRVQVRELRRSGRGPEHLPFAPGSSMGEVGQDVVVVDAASHEVWLFDATAGHFTPVVVPAGERCQRVEELRLDDKDEDAALKVLLGTPAQAWRSPGFVRGERQGYVVRDGALVAVPGVLERADRRRRDWLDRTGSRLEHDPLVFTLELPADGSPVTFRHEFRPRTAVEWLHAGTAMAWSLLRPPVLQVVGNLQPIRPRAAWMFDRLTVDGRRPWLVFVSCLFTGVLAFGFIRRLRRLGASAATAWWWGATIVVLGPPALVLGAVLERPRRYAQHATTAPVPLPRIHTSPSEVA